MKKLILAAALVVMTGCAEKTDSVNTAAYEEFWNMISEADITETASRNYTVSTEMAAESNGRYAYYIVIDEPRIAMYDIRALAVEENLAYTTSRMMPSAGLFDEPFSMVPGQVNKNSGFVKGIILSGETDQQTLTVELMVEWTDQTGAQTYREFLKLDLEAE